MTHGRSRPKHLPALKSDGAAQAHIARDSRPTAAASKSTSRPHMDAGVSEIEHYILSITSHHRSNSFPSRNQSCFPVSTWLYFLFASITLDTNDECARKPADNVFSLVGAYGKNKSDSSPSWPYSKGPIKNGFLLTFLNEQSAQNMYVDYIFSDDYAKTPGKDDSGIFSSKAVVPGLTIFPGAPKTNLAKDNGVLDDYDEVYIDMYAANLELSLT